MTTTAIKKSTATKKDSVKALNADRLYATGRRKSASARVFMRPGNGKVTVNGRDIEAYFARPVSRMVLNQPFAATKTAQQYDIRCTVKGSGLSGQAGAIRLGIARCLAQVSEDMKKVLRSGGFLTRDSRKVERKKYGRKKARKSFQFSKR
jgi:small subunit ribosomal protein S9